MLHNNISVTVQVVVGLFLQTFMLGAIFVKIARPKYRANTILFSDKAVVNQEDGKLVLQVIFVCLIGVLACLT